MKKTISIVVLTALISAVAVVLVCTDVKFDNPLDKKGTNLFENQLKEDSEYDTAGALLPDPAADGVANYFTNAEKYRKKCDKTVPVVSLVGPRSVTITTQDIVIFKKWMRIDAVLWDSLITWTADNGNVEPLKPRLTRGAGDVDYKENQVPDPGNYMIVYRVQKPECDGKTPGSDVSRELIVQQYVPPDTATPTLIRVGSDRVEIKEGEKYSDEGVTVMLGSQDITMDAVDSVVLKRATGARVNGWQKPVDFTKIALPDNTPANSGFTVTYYASRNGRPTNPASVVRNVTVTENIVVGTTAVIVLTPYKHNNIPGVSKVIEHPDTMMTYGGTYSEKGATAYYEKDGAKVPIDANLITMSNPPSTSSSSPIRRPRTYNLGAGSGYSAASPKTRYVYLVDNSCDGKSPPEITLTGSDNIPAGVEWKYEESWRVTNRDYDGDVLVGGQSAGFRYLIDFGGLDPDKPAKGTYTITYVGLGGCGSIATKTRVVTVP